MNEETTEVRMLRIVSNETSEQDNVMGTRAPPFRPKKPRGTNQNLSRNSKKKHFDEVQRTLHELLLTKGDLIPCDLVLLRELWPAERSFPKDEVVTEAIQHLVAERIRFRQVVVGREYHIARGSTRSQSRNQKKDQKSPPDSDKSAPESDENHTSTLSFSEEFDLQIAVDVEHERVLLYRVLVMMELIAAFLLLREGILWWLKL